MINVLEIFGCSFLISRYSHLVFLLTCRRRLTFLFFTEPLSLNLLACLLIVLGLGTGRPGNFTPNLRRVSEHDFLLFICVFLQMYVDARDHLLGN